MYLFDLSNGVEDSTSLKAILRQAREILKAPIDPSDYDSSEGNDLIFGDNGEDKLNGGKGNDRLIGDKGRDYLYGDGGRDILDGGSDQDRIFGGGGHDLLFGGGGNDILLGGAGNDILLGGNGADSLYDNTGGHNILAGGAGNDFLATPRASISGSTTFQGGTGDDTFYIQSLKTKDLTIDDFQQGEDKIALSYNMGFQSPYEDYNNGNGTIDPSREFSSIYVTLGQNSTQVDLVDPSKLSFELEGRVNLTKDDFIMRDLDGNSFAYEGEVIYL